MNKKVLGIAAVAIFFIFAVLTFYNALNPYVSLREAATASGRTVQVLGQLAGEITYDASHNELRFYIVDDEGTRAPVIYRGAKPNNMEHAESVVVVGKFEESHFVAEQLLVKCPSKYQEEGDR